ncbi:hypothetical protein [Verrucomicrobium spinosum]|uniref:hypothetical protein n=1 Tax=Verrucomicrobium spinosum TaxID=2736 RepID=UPI001C484B65|nr:hypothetical protein [Verrucomicrobium spinosum]
MNGSDRAWDMVETAMDQLYAGMVNGLTDAHGGILPDAVSSWDNHTMCQRAG